MSEKKSEPANDAEREALGFDPLHLMATLLLGWLVPGLGHLTVGRFAKGIMFFVVLGLTYSVGIAFAEQHAILPKEHPFAFVGQLGLGLPTLIVVLRGRGEEALMAPGPERVPFIDTGILFTTVAGLLNYLVLLDAFLWAKEGGDGEPDAKDGDGEDAAASAGEEKPEPATVGAGGDAEGETA